MELNQEPLFTTLFAEKWALAAQTPKPTAMDTMLRYSGAHGCSRRMGYDWFEAEYTTPPTPASIVQAAVGTLIGEQAAQAQIDRYGGEAEKQSKINEWISGSADWYCETTPLGIVVYEHKMKSSYAFNKAMGYKRGFGKAAKVKPGGAPADAIVQAGMNALGIENTYGVTVDQVVVGIQTTDVVSVRENQQINVPDHARFSGEWLVPRSVWEPRAKKEINRMGAIAETLDLGYIPDRLAVDDDEMTLRLNPESGPWQCNYCPFMALCQADGPGQVRVLDSKMERRVPKNATE